MAVKAAPRTIRAALYLRISQDKTGKAAGVERQEEDCRELAATLGWDIVGVYPDNDTSATNLRKPRKQYERMLADIRADLVDAIICWHPDRLYRRPTDLESLIDLVETYHTLLRTVRAGELDLSTPSGRLVGRLFAAVARHEVEQKADRWKRAYLQQRKKGVPVTHGPRHFGFDRDGVTHVDDEVEHIDWMADQILSGVGELTVCRMLDERGVRTTMGNRWKPPSLRKLLLSPKLVGLAVMNAEVIGPGSWLPVMDRGKWEAVGARLRRTTRRDVRPRTNVLVGTLHCGTCGTRMEGARQIVRRRGEVVRDESGKALYNRAYRCPSRYFDSCGRVSIAAEPTEALLEEAARRRWQDPRFRREVAGRTFSPASAAVAAEVDQLEARRLELEAEMTKPGAGSVATLRRALVDIDEQITRRRASLAEHQPAVMPPAVDEWPDDVETRSTLIRIALGRVLIHPHPSGGGRRADGGYFLPERIEIPPLA